MEKNKKPKQLLIMTSFGPVPYESVKEHLPKTVVDVLEANKEKLLASDENAPMEVSHYVQLIADRMGWRLEKMEGYLDALYNINPSTVFSLILKEIAVELDKKYEGHINNCEELFIISTMDGRIHKVPRAYIRNFRNFAAFRTEEDAKTACSILREPLKEMFKSVRK